MLRHERFRLDQGPAVTFDEFYGDLKRSGAVEDKARARQEWSELKLRSSGRVTEAQWRTLVKDFKMLRLRVGNASEDEATRLAKKLVPQAFVEVYFEHEEKEQNKLKVTGVDNYTATEIGNFFRSIRIPVKEVKPDCKGYMLAELERREQVDDALEDDSILGVTSLALKSEGIFDWVFRKSRSRSRRWQSSADGPSRMRRWTRRTRTGSRRRTENLNGTAGN